MIAWLVRGARWWELIPSTDVGALRNTHGELVPRDRWFFARRRDAARWGKRRGLQVTPR